MPFPINLSKSPTYILINAQIVSPLTPLIFVKLCCYGWNTMTGILGCTWEWKLKVLDWREKSYKEYNVWSLWKLIGFHMENAILTVQCLLVTDTTREPFDHIL